MAIAKLAHSCDCSKFDASQKNPVNRESGASSKDIAYKTFEKAATKFTHITFGPLSKNMMHFKKLSNTATKYINILGIFTQPKFKNFQILINS